MRAIRLASNIICSAMTLGAYGLGFFLSIATAFYLFDQWPSLWGIAVGMLFWIVVLLSLPDSAPENSPSRCRDPEHR